MSPTGGGRPARVLVAAYACEPDKGSEPGVGWNWVKEISRNGYEVHVITRANNRAAIENELRGSPIARAHFHYVDLGPVWLHIKRRLGYPGLIAYYYVWQLKVAGLARRLHRRYGFRLTHHVTFVIDWMPSGLAVLPIPFIWGPVGGSTNRIPPGVELSLPLYARRHELVRRAAQACLKRLDPFLALTRRRAARILTFTTAALEGIPAAHRGKARAITHVGVRESDLPAGANGARAPLACGLSIVSGGRLVHWKGLDLLVEGFAAHQRDSQGASRLLFTGGGPYQPFLLRLVRRLGVEGSVCFLGQLPSREQVYARLLASDLYALPTLRDGPPVAILEAMLAGLPVLCLDHGATGELVPPQAGLKVPVGTRPAIVSGISQALNWALGHPAELQAMGASAREHVLAHHHWTVIGGEIGRVYREVLRARAEHDEVAEIANARTSC